MFVVKISEDKIVILDIYSILEIILLNDKYHIRVRDKNIVLATYDNEVEAKKVLDELYEAMKSSEKGYEIQ